MLRCSYRCKKNLQLYDARKNKSTYSTTLRSLVHTSTNTSLYVQNVVVCHFSVSGHFLRTSGTRRFNKSRRVQQGTIHLHISNVLYQGNNQLFTEGQIPRSCTFGMAPARRSCTHQSKRGGKLKSDRKISRPSKVSPPVSTSRTTTSR